MRHPSFSALLGCYTKSSRPRGSAASCDYLILAEHLRDERHFHTRGERVAEVISNVHIV